ncbi:MAG: DUF4377 domain-containing protein [Sphingomonadaceae bacterium]
MGLAALLAGCASSTAAQRDTPGAGAPAVMLAAQHWDLVEWTGQALPEGKPLRLDFDAANGRFSSATTCNRVMGGYSATGTTLRLGGKNGGLASTMMACPEPAMQMERAYVQALGAVTGYRIDAGQLVLTAADGVTLAYQAAHKPAADAPRKFIYVSAETKPCTGVAPMTCLQIREKESDPWTLHYYGIEGFTPEPGIEYRLRIIEEKVANPPADASSIRWTLDQVIEQRVVTPAR